MPRKYDNELSDSSEDARVSRGMKRQYDSPDDSPVKRQSPAMNAINNERAKKGSHDANLAKKYSGKVDEAPQSDVGSPLQKAKKRTHSSNHIDHDSSGSEESEKHRSHSEKQRHRKGHKHKRHNGDSSESDSDSDGKDSKRRRREEKRLRKEERRLRREERHRKRADRHASKQKLKYVGTPPSDLEKDHQSGSDADVKKKGSYTPREEPDPNKLEVELRQKALESFSAKKSKHAVTPYSDIEKDTESNSDADVGKRIS
jgi:serine/arginine repetitive matrix protein 1